MRQKNRAMLALRPARADPLQPTLQARFLAGCHVEAHPRRALQMRTKDRARRKHYAVTLRGFRQRKRIVDMRETRPDEHAIRGLDKKFEADALEDPQNIAAGVSQPLVQTGQILA